MQVDSGIHYYGLDQGVVVSNNTFTKQAKLMAENNGVELWDGNILNLMREKANRYCLFGGFANKDENYDVLKLFLKR